MKIKELINLLKEYDENLEVLLSSDSEGNSYGKITEYSFGDAIFINNEYGLEVRNPDDFDEEDIEYFKDFKPCIIIYP